MKMNGTHLALPPVRDGMKPPLPHFPTAHQAVIFRLWESVPAERIASVLGCDEKFVVSSARDMALGPQRDTGLWRERGYITIIRAVWHLLPYEQILELLGIGEDELAFILKEDDFLSVKLGGAKPACDRVTAGPLTASEIRATAAIREAMEKNVRIFDSEERRAPFDFFGGRGMIPAAGPCPEGTADIRGWVIDDRTGDPVCASFASDFRDDILGLWNTDLLADKSGCAGKKISLTIDRKLSDRPGEYHEIKVSEDGASVSAGSREGIFRGLCALRTETRFNGGPYLRTGVRHRTPVFDARFIYSYQGLYGAPLDTERSVSFPEGLLREYAECGVNGIWLQAVLYKLVEFPFDPSLSEGREKRIVRLRELIGRCARHGLKVYLYLNEPRAMPLSFFEKHPGIKGFERGGLACLCTSHPAVRDYIAGAVREICTSCPGLGGFFTISASENLTNCYSHAKQEAQTCPRCRLRRREEVVAELNSLIADTAHSVDPEIKTIVWTWAWRGFGAEERLRAIGLLSKNCIVQNTAEEMMEIEKGGIRSRVSDYTLSNIPPSAESVEGWREARRTCHGTSAKIQINTTWEASTAPYVPVFPNVLKYLENLRAEGVGNLQLSWTLGGWPSDNLRIAAASFFDEERPLSYPEILRASYGEYANCVRRAADRFSEAFAEFPFNIEVLYRGPQNAGPSNLLWEHPTGLKATMTCYAFDDLDRWRGIYPEEVYLDQLKKLSDGWREGMTFLDGMPDCEFKDVAFICGALFESSLNQALFIVERRAGEADPSDPGPASRMADLAERELRLARKVYRVMLRRPQIGYEAANHYYFSAGSIAEKIINCEYLIRRLKRRGEDAFDIETNHTVRED